ncbi:MAG: hypothetical protein KJZ93_04080 [Caldilineaceae bacterium]|nr:hypothetical protein [Caldilineaceae bacterium]
MCCLWTILIFLGPRAAILVWWLIDSARVTMAVGNNFLWAILGWVFLPWTTLIYIFLMPVNGLVGFDWVWIALGLLADLGMYGGGAYGNRGRIQGVY